MVRAGLALLLVAPIAAGQAPPPAPAAQPQPQQKQMDPALWAHLQGWEGVMKGAGNFVSERGTKTEVENVPNGRQRTYDTTIWCMKPNMARMRLDLVPPPGQKPDPNEFTTYICNGRSVFEYDGAARDVNGKLTPTVTEYPLGPNGGVGDNLLLEFMSGSISALQAAQRFSIEWVQQNDQRYLILELTPLLPKDKQEFDKMTLVLIKPGLQAPLDRLAYLPRLAKIVKPNAKVLETWDFPEPKLNAVKANNVPIGPNDFKAVDPGKGWRTIRADAKPPAQTPPRVARPNGQ